MRAHSPTVVTLYTTTNYQHVKHVDRVNAFGDMAPYDIEGYDEYGYNVLGVDRAGIKHDSYDIDLYIKIRQEWKDYSGIPVAKKSIEEVVVTLFTDNGKVKTTYPIEMFDDAVALFKDYVSTGKKSSISTN